MKASSFTGCRGCEQASLFPISRDKWGSCPLCIALAAGGAVIGWSFTLSFWLLYPDPLIKRVLVAVSLCFTAVLAVHVAAYRIRSAKQDS